VDTHERGPNRVRWERNDDRGEKELQIHGSGAMSEAQIRR